MTVKKKPKQIFLTEEHQEMIEKLKTAMGITSASHIIYFAITELYRKHYKPYGTGGMTGNKTPKTDENEARCLTYAEKMRGEIIEREGVKYVRYKKYFWDNETTHEIELLALTETIANARFGPSKVQVDNARAEKGLPPVE